MNGLGIAWVPALLAVAGLAGCATAPRPPAPPPELHAVHTAVPVRIDGRLDDAAWLHAPAYPLQLAANLPGHGSGPREPGRARFAWDEAFFYLAVEFDDSDVVAEGERDGQHHYLFGDLAELFLWPEAQPWYVELYVTPGQRFSTFLFPSGGRKLPGCTATNAFPLRVAAQVDGTLNRMEDRDRGWRGELAVPVHELRARGAAWGPDAAWRVLVGRYNYSVWLSREELTELPALPATNFHLREHYGRLRLLPPAAK